ncbi:polysaccharide deacetylase family protein [Nocardia gipuzkoensis]|uniref:polysaccharide deacetylase family protein n=1 Tax=Nocardia gipuzkoensis TaxID=2749991 RepID=UPI00237DC650|nr:polysaccharide deacetylase family protein [Nocardia gipuzkoensis]MDE1675308.1 polysaccharide deacetylase family protein [Nocardia gipuzkoensis]
MTGVPPFDYSPITSRPPMEFPGGARVAVWFGVSVEAYELGRPSTSLAGITAMLDPDPLNYSWRDYGARVGIWRMMNLFDRYKLRASVFLSSDAARAYPEIIAAGNERSWAWLVHGKNNTTFHTGLGVDEERQSLEEMIETVRAATGQQPLGWLGPGLTETHNTPELLSELGVRYLCDWCNDDQPYPLKVGNPLVSVPYTIEVNDIPMMTYGYAGDSLAGVITDSFDVLFEEGEQSGRVLGIGLHPFVMGAPWRHKYFARALEYMDRFRDDVWFTTSDEIAAWYLDTYYERDRSR